MPIFRRSSGRGHSGIQGQRIRAHRRPAIAHLIHSLPSRFLILHAITLLSYTNTGRYEREVPEYTSAWRQKPDIPTVADLLCTDVAVPSNRVKGKWQNVEQYDIHRASLPGIGSSLIFTFIDILGHTMNCCEKMLTRL